LYLIRGCLAPNFRHITLDQTPKKGGKSQAQYSSGAHQMRTHKQVLPHEASALGKVKKARERRSLPLEFFDKKMQIAPLPFWLLRVSFNVPENWQVYKFLDKVSL